MDKILYQEILDFRDDRDWGQFHNPKDLAISISLEAAELLELFQWSGEKTDVPEKRQEMADELADIMIYGVLMADAANLDLATIIKNKLAKNKKKYPVETARGSKKKYTELKNNFRSGKL